VQFAIDCTAGQNTFGCTGAPALPRGAFGVKTFGRSSALPKCPEGTIRNDLRTEVIVKNISGTGVSNVKVGSAIDRRGGRMVSAAAAHRSC
jgi:hypothetical protein